jgi:hypothetical protein
MTDDDLLRYSRHILLNEIGSEGQARIGAAHALVVGAGGLGSAAAFYLASAGIGRLTLADGDRVAGGSLQHDGPCSFRGQLERRLVRIHLRDGLVLFDVIAIGDEPLGDFNFADGLPGAGDFHFKDGHGTKVAVEQKWRFRL